MKLPLAYYGDAILRKKGVPVKEFNDELKQLVNDMIDSMNAYDGMGLAAPQVHKSLMLFITCVPQPDAEGKYHPGTVIKVYINPKLSLPSQEKWFMDEGCISIPKLYGNVERPVKITVEAYDLEGKPFTEHLIGLDARVVMHENDHINGVLYIDRLSEEEKRRLEPSLREIKKTYSGK